MSVKVSPPVAAGMVQKWEEELCAELGPDARAVICRAVENGRLDESSGDFIVRLVKPVTLDGGQAVDTLTIREPTAGELRQASKGNRDDMEITIHLVSLITGQDVRIIDRISQRDATLIGALLGFFR